MSHSIQVKKCLIPWNKLGNKNKLSDSFLMAKEDFFFDTWISFFYSPSLTWLLFLSYFARFITISFLGFSFQWIMKVQRGVCIGKSPPQIN